MMRFERFYKSVWFFPGLLLIFLVLLSCLRISGSSIGMYYPVFYGSTAKDPNLLLGEPRSIRSDEWLFVTQMAISQHNAGYPLVNHNIEYSKNMSVVGDAPYKDWSAIFRPENLAFFVLPFEIAFAFKWWLLLYAVIISCYFLVLRLLRARRLVAALIGLGVGCTPFIFWWYQVGTLAPIFYGFLVLILGMRIVNNEPARFLKSRPLLYSQLIYSLALSYLLACFILILYPPFQIPIAIAFSFFLIGFLLDRYGLSKQLFSKNALRVIGSFFFGILLASLIILAFICTRPGVIHALTNTVYPGKRIVLAGGTPIHEILSTYLQPQLQRQSRAIHYYANQSEASNFVLFLPFLLVPGFILLFYEYRLRQRVNWPLLMVQLCAVLFLLDMFMPGLQIIYKLSLLDRVPHARLFIGLGFVGIIDLLLILQAIIRLNVSKKFLNLAVPVYLIACIAPLAWAGQYTRSHYPEFIHSWLLISFFGLFFVTIIFCFLTRRILLGALLFAIFSLGSVFNIHPLYRGLGPIYKNKVYDAIDRISKPSDTWVVLDNGIFENLAIMANRNSLSGIQPYPDLKFWRQVEGSKDDYIYNRYAHVNFSSNPNINKLSLVQADSFQVKFSCDPFIETRVQYVLVTHPITYTCVNKVGVIQYPAITFFIYKVL